MKRKKQADANENDGVDKRCCAFGWGRCTQKKLTGGNARLYLHVFDWPKDGRLVVPGLANKPVKAFVLASGKSLDMTADGSPVAISVPVDARDIIASVIGLDIKGIPALVKSKR